MLRLGHLPRGARIVDLGGTPTNWELLPHDFQVTLVNLEIEKNQNPRYTYVTGDATSLRHLFADNSFDFVYSNSTIEHVGDESKQAAFAQEVQRLAPAFWVQTPSPKFPIEAHCAVPFYWKLPTKFRSWLLAKWEQKLPAWTQMMRGTRVLDRSHFRALFPESKFLVETFWGLEKSFVCYRSCTSAKPTPKREQT